MTAGLLAVGQILASRTFEMADQLRFGAASGDRNPIHVDAIVARRTQAGEPVVHGTHLLLWALDQIVMLEPAWPGVAGLQARFDSFVRLHETVSLKLVNLSATQVRLDLLVQQATVAVVAVTFGAAQPPPPPVAATSLLIDAPAEACPLTLEQMQGIAGRLNFVAPDLISAMFPHATRWLGAKRVAALGAMTHLVGMVCPGLHSIFGRIKLQAYDDPATPDELHFKASADDRLRSVRLTVMGGGFAGQLDTLARMPPTAQADYATLSRLVEPTEFAGSHALVIGGSRGLGELTAKLLAAGGSRVTVTYRIGRDDADRVADEIRAAGHRCEVCCYDALKPAGPQLDMLPEAPTHGYYFATATIAGRKHGLLDAKRLEQFLAMYVDGFWQFSRTLHDRRPDVRLFYPSTAYIKDRPDGLLEYAMSKASGEVLCAEINRMMPTMHVVSRRLPPLPTDQTGGMSNLGETAANIMLTVIRELHLSKRVSEEIKSL